MDISELLSKFKELKNSTEDQIKSKNKEIADQKKTIDDLKKSVTSGFISGPKSNSDEAKALAYFNGDIRKLISVNTGSPKFQTMEKSVKNAINNLKEDILVSRIFQQNFYGEPFDREGSPAIVKGILDHDYGKEVLKYRLKAFGSETSGSGAEFIRTAQPELYVEETLDHDLGLFSRLNQQNMTTSTHKVMVKGRTVARASMERQAPRETNFGTGAIELKAKKFVEYYSFPEEFVEDNAIDIIKAGIEDIKLSHIRAYDLALISGTEKKSASWDHIDSDVNSQADADDVRHHWDGLRKKALSSSVNGTTLDFSNSNITAELCNKMYSRVTSGSLLWATSKSGYHQMINLPEVKTINTYGNDATIKTGVLYTLWGIPIFESEWIRDDLNITGMHGKSASETDTNYIKDRSGILLINTDRIYAGNRGGIRIYLSRNNSNDVNELRGWSRKAFNSLDQSRTNRDIIYGINIKR